MKEVSLGEQAKRFLGRFPIIGSYDNGNDIKHGNQRHTQI
jgi:hypothetical protein